jgi:hypothetical protein
VAAVANRLVAAYGGTVGRLFTVGPLGFALSSPAAKAANLSKDTQVRFVESVVTFSGTGIRDVATWWAQDRIDQETSVDASRDFRLRWAEYDPGPLGNPALWIVDAEATDHSVLSGLTRTFGTPLTPQCTSTEVGSGHGLAVAALAVGAMSATQSLPRSVTVIPALGKGLLPGDCTVAKSYDILTALQTVLRDSRPGDVVNLSFGGSELSGYIEASVQALIENGRIVVASAGTKALLSSTTLRRTSRTC